MIATKASDRSRKM